MALDPAASGGYVADDATALTTPIDTDRELEHAEAVAVVDPYSSGRYLVDEIRQRGWPVVAVRSSLTLGDELLTTWNPGPFEDILVHHGDVADTAAALRRASRPLKAVIAGSEPGVGLADALANELGLRCNDISLSQCRSDRYLMHERLRECELRACRQSRCSSPAEAATFAQELARWPVIVKSPCSYSNGGVYCCLDASSLEKAVEDVLVAKDAVGKTIGSALVQEFLDGDEYIVDCVSLDGQHFVAAIWLFKMTRFDEGGIAYDRTQTLPYDVITDGCSTTLHSYVSRCLDALGVRNGASTSRVAYGDAEGPCLVEMGARLHGNLGPALWSKCAGREQGQAFLVADIFTNEGRELSRRINAVTQGEPAYKLKQFSAQVDLQCHEEGLLEKSVEYASGDWIRALPTFWMVKIFVEEDDRLELTRSLESSPGYIILIGPDAAAVEQDLELIRQRERSGDMYPVRPCWNAEDGMVAMVSTPGGAMVALSSQASMSGRGRAPISKDRELDAQGGYLLSPLASRAASPVISPLQAPALPPGVDELDEFSLDGIEGDEGAMEFKLDGMDGLDYSPLNKPILLGDATAKPGGVLDAFSLDG